MTTVSKLFGAKAPKVFKSKQKAVSCAFPELVVGVELETENASPDVYRYLNYAEENGNIWRVDRDGSLRGGDTAYEFISEPVRLDQLIPELQAFFDFTKFDDRNYSDRCSVHVHSNVTDYTQDMLAALGLAYTVTEETLFEFVNHFKSPTKEGYGRDTNLYCIPWNQCRMNYKLVEGIFNPAATKKIAKWQKYTALNLLPITTQGTVEWRHMHGTADMEKLTIWLNVIGSLLKFAQKMPLDDLIGTIKTLNDTSAYQQFFTDIFGDYLKYDPSYAKTLSEGVVNAKYSLMGWDRTKVEKIPEKPIKVERDPFAETMAEMRRNQEERRRAEIDERHRQEVQEARELVAAARDEPRIRTGRQEAIRRVNVRLDNPQGLTAAVPVQAQAAEQVHATVEALQGLLNAQITPAPRMWVRQDTGAANARVRVDDLWWATDEAEVPAVRNNEGNTI